jgi:hypothetical protein
MANFRPVSNISLFAKVIERVVANQVTEHLEEGSHLHPFQSAYRRNFSTESALLKVTSDWRHSLASNRMVCVVSLDISAAFDTVSHHRLIMRLQQVGVSSVPLEWFRSYLSERKMAVKIRSSVSRSHAIGSGVPQGSVLGPTLFNLYMAELAWTLEGLGITFHIYADDVLLYEEFDGHCALQSFSRVQEGLKAIQDWMEANRLMLNASKTSVHILRPQRGVVPVLPSLHLHGEILEVCDKDLKWLGIPIDRCLTFEPFVLGKCKSAYHQLRMISFLQNSIDKPSKQLLINALVASRLLYCDSLLVGVTDQLLSKVQRVWNHAARISVSAGKYDHVTPILEQLEWPTARQRTWLKIARLIFLSMHGCAPQYLKCEEKLSQRELRSGANGAVLLKLETECRTVEKGCWRIVAARLWNAMPVEFRVIGRHSLSEFLRSAASIV